MKRAAVIAAVAGFGVCLILSVLFTLVYASFALGQSSVPAFGYFAAGLAVSVVLFGLIRWIAKFA